MSSPSVHSTPDPAWKGLYKIGGIAALVAGLVFRRNWGAEASLFSKTPPPTSVIDWFALLQQNRLLGLIYLDAVDLLDYALLGLMFLALFAALRQVNPGAIAAGTVAGLLGIGVYFASNTAFSMLSLSRQYAAATDEAQKSLFLAAGQAMLALSDLTSTGVYTSYFLLALGSLLVSIVMLRSTIFNKATAVVGILAGALDLAYCLAYPFLPASAVELAGLATIPAAGLFWMIWHILVGWKLIQNGGRRGV
jgi:hypothetical protein